MSILVIAAHPDDEVLGCGGAISKFVSQKEDVYITILGQGFTSRLANPDTADQNEIQALHEQSKKAATFLGAKDLFMYNLPDNRFDSLPLLDIIKPVENLIHQLKPQTIYTHHPGDLNIDHQLTHRAVITATRPLGGCPVKEIYTFEIPSSTEWAFNPDQSFFPNYFIDITGHLENKTKALQFYTTEIKEAPHPRSDKHLKALAAVRGAAVGKKYCEAFTLIRKID